MNTGKNFNQFALNRIKERILEQARGMNNVTYKHVLRIHNKTADELANKATKRSTGQVRENEEIYDHDIP